MSATHRRRLTALIASLAAAGTLAACGDDDDGQTASTPASASQQRAAPTAATPESLKALQAELKRPVFWVGPQSGKTYELTQTADRSVYVRYLDGGVAIGSPDAKYVTVGTYPQEDPYATVQAAAKRKGAQVDELPRDGLAVSNDDRPGSVYLAYPDSEALVEVFAPETAAARKLVRDGKVVPVAG